MKNTIFKINIAIILCSSLLMSCNFIEKSKCDNEQVKTLLLELTSNQIATEFFIHKAIEDKHLEGLLSISYIEAFSGKQLKDIADEKSLNEFIKNNIKITEVRTDDLNDEIQKCYCSANITVKNGYAYYAVSYSAQITEDNKIYVQLLRIPQRVEIEEGKLASDIWNIQNHLKNIENKKYEQQKISTNIVEESQEDVIEIEEIVSSYQIESEEYQNDEDIIYKIENTPDIEKLDFREILSEANNNISTKRFPAYQIVNEIERTYKTTSHYQNIVSKLIELNKGLNKEWNKNQEYFSSKIDFYETYTAENYRSNLRQRKK